MKRTIRNRFAKKCFTCSADVGKNLGFACQDDSDKWFTYCETCVPVRIEMAAVRAEITAEGNVYFPYDENHVVAVKSLHGAKFNKEGKFWNVSVEPKNLPRVIEISKHMGLKIADELVAANVVNEENILDHIKDTIGNKSVFPYQVEGVRFMNTMSKCLLGDQMGLGKTIQVLCALKKNAAVLVVCPAALKYNWREEAAKWRPDFQVSILNGRKSFRFPKGGEIVITNYDVLPAEFEKQDEFILVCDEIHCCKNYSTKRHKAVKELAKIADRVIGLTGTPLMNRPFDLFGVLSSLTLEKIVFGSWQNFMNQFGGRKNHFGGYDFDGPTVLVPELLRRVMLRRCRDEVLPDLPKKSYTTLVCNGISSELRKKLDNMYDEYQEVIDMEELPPFEAFSGLRSDLASSRIPAMLELVESHEEEEVPLIVFSAHRNPIIELGKRDGWEIITGDTKSEERQKIVNRFQAGELRGVGLTIQAGGVGLTLTKAWKAIFVDLDWTPALNQQAEDRLCRIGQTRPVEIVRLVSDHVLDKHILNLLSSKISLFEKAIDQKIELNKANAVEAKNETEEEFQQRMNNLVEEIKAEQKSQEQKAAIERVERMRDREIDKLPPGGVTFPEFTEELVECMKNAMESMLSVCDGAFTRDQAGFNKPDACLSRFLYHAGFDKQATKEAAYLMLRRYPRQLKSDFNLLWKK